LIHVGVQEYTLSGGDGN